MVVQRSGSQRQLNEVSAKGSRFKTSKIKIRAPDLMAKTYQTLKVQELTTTKKEVKFPFF